MKKVSDNKTPHKSSEYDVNVIKTIPFYECFHQQTIDLVKTIKPDVKEWLDTGCGTGFLVEKALPVFKDCIFVLADPSAEMLMMVKNRLESHKNIKPENDEMIDLQLDRWMSFQLTKGRSKKEVAEHRKRFGVKYFPIKVSEHLKLLDSAGFREMEIFWLSYLQAGFICIK